MMSEEEKDDNGTFIRHWYAWLSDKFNRFIDKLEECMAKNSKNPLQRIEHMVTHLIHHLHSMLMSEMEGGTAATNNGPQSDEIFSSSDETENNRTD